jgi:hypothetical protein
MVVVQERATPWYLKVCDDPPPKQIITMYIFFICEPACISASQPVVYFSYQEVDM